MRADVAIVADAHLGEAEVAQRGLGPFDSGQHGHRDLRAVGHAAGQAGRRRLVPRAQAETSRGLADVGLREAGGDKRERGAALGGGPLPRPMIAEVVDVDAEHDRAPSASASGASTSISSALQW